MFVITVIPIARGIGVEELSYFTPEALPEGAIVSVPLRGRKIKGLVVSSTPARDAKTDLKSAGFALKKLDKVEAEGGFAPAFLKAARKTAAYDGVTLGAVLHALFPLPLLPTLRNTMRKSDAIPSSFAGRFIVQAEDADRYTIYKSLIREMFAKGSSVFLALPSVQDIEHIDELMEKGIKEYTYILHGGLSQNELRKRLSSAVSSEHPVLILGTSYFLGIPRSDIAAIILDKESSSAYRIQGRPHTDLRRFAENYADESGARFIVGDIMLRVETLYRKDRGDYEPLARPKSRLISTAAESLIDMKSTKEQPSTGRWAVFSPEMVDAITAARKEGGQTFLLGIRKGYSPMTVCGDCGQVLTCPNCAAPVVLYRRLKKVETEGIPPSPSRETNESTPQTNMFVCHRCGEERPPEFTCPNCTSWRLVPLGIGIDQAMDVLLGRFPDLPLFRLDRDTVSSHKEARKIADEFYGTPGAVMIGTEMALPYLTRPITTIGVLSVNSLLTIPDFRMGERVFRLLLSLRARADRRFLIQTRDTKTPLFSLATTGNISEFVSEELKVREALSYPPFSVLIKLTYEGSKEEGERVLSDIERTFAPFCPVTFPAFVARVKGKYRMNALIKIPPKHWPDPELLTLLSALPQEVDVRVDPDSVL